MTNNGNCKCVHASHDSRPIKAFHACTCFINGGANARGVCKNLSNFYVNETSTTTFCHARLPWRTFTLCPFSDYAISRTPQAFTTTPEQGLLFPVVCPFPGAYSGKSRDKAFIVHYSVKRPAVIPSIDLIANTNAQAQIVE